MMEFESRDEASNHAARLIVEELSRVLSVRERATLIVSGGSSPLDCFRRLRGESIEWSRVDVLLTDERQVAATHPDSNERMLRENLLLDHAAAARFVPLKAEAVAGLTRPHACCLVGMGEDGHFASIFPDAADLDELLALGNAHRCREVKTGASPWPRITLTLAELVQSNSVLVLAFGERKHDILRDPDGYPVQALLRQTRAPVEVLWAK